MSKEIAQDVAQSVFKFAFTGRLQIPHVGHVAVTRAMLNTTKSNNEQALIAQVDLPPNNLNPHSSRQIENMFRIAFPNEMRSGELVFKPVSSFNSGGLQRKEFWDAISGNNPQNLTIFFGKKSSADDQIGSLHYMEHLARKFDFTAIPIDPIKRTTNGREDVSASNLLENPYHSSLKSSVHPGILKYMAELWQTAFEEQCQIADVTEPNQGAYQRFSKGFSLGKVLIVTRDGEAAQANAEAFLGKPMKNTPDR